MFNYEPLTKAFNCLHSGAQLIGMNKSRYMQREQGLHLGGGQPYVSCLVLYSVQGLLCVKQPKVLIQVLVSLVTTSCSYCVYESCCPSDSTDHITTVLCVYVLLITVCRNSLKQFESIAIKLVKARHIYVLIGSCLSYRKTTLAVVVAITNSR